jgi:hypothetical protein
MKKIDNISSIEGRIILHNIFHKLRFERQRSSISSLFILWRICVSDSEINQYLKEDIEMLHKLGLLRGTAIWLEEIVNRYYFSTMNSFVYFGAAVLLVLIGVNRFTDKVDNSIVIYGLGFEASMLIFMFIIMLFTPNADVTDMSDEDQEDELVKELLNDIGEISRDFAVTSTQLEKITDHLISVSDKQNALTNILSEIANSLSDATSPNPKMLEMMQATNKTLLEFNENIEKLNSTANKLKHEEIEVAGRKEVEKILTNNIANS